jgi:signal transduction histidine kinase
MRKNIKNRIQIRQIPTNSDMNRFMKRLLRCFLALGFSCLTMVSEAALLRIGANQVNLLESAQFLEDPFGQWTLGDVQAMESQFRHWTRGGTEMNFGFTSSAYWIRVPLQRQENAPASWLLEVHFARLDQLDFYPPSGQVVNTGSSRPFSSRPYFDRHFVFPLDVSNQSDYFYMRVTSNYTLTIPLTGWQPDAYRQHQQRFQWLQFMYYGGLIVLAMYGLIIYLALRDDRFLVYACYIISAGVGMFASNGFGRQLFWSASPAFDEVSQTAFLSLAAFFAALFARKLLTAHGERPWFVNGMRLSEWLFLTSSVLSFFHLGVPGTLGPANQLLLFTTLVMGLLVSIAGVQEFMHQRQDVRFFMIGWLVLWLGVGVATLRAYGVLPSNGFTSYAVQLSTVVEMLFMALALGDILRTEHRAYVSAQAQTLQANQALLEVTQASEGKLKQAVKKQTAQLEASLKLERNLREQYVRFGSMISHEFRTPLSIIQSQTSLMRKEHERGLNQVSKRLEAIGSATHRLTVMFDKWLHSDAIAQSLEVLEPKPLALQPWLRTLIQTNPHLLLNHAVKLQLTPEINTLVADEYHLGVALTNLIDNAAKYSPADTTITIVSRSKTGYVGIAVTDEGPGIAHDSQGKVFSEFFRLAPESQVRGVGLGLSIVQRIVQAHAGHVTLDSTPGQGATFCVWLPDLQCKDVT